jgi:3-oxoacyl-[acyl-carrier protein] reductase
MIAKTKSAPKKKRTPRILTGPKTQPAESGADRGRPAALITGGAKGIGRAIALALAEDGHNIGIVTRRSTKEAVSVLAECDNFGVRSHCWVADLTDADAADKVVAEFQQHFKRWEVLINNVGDYWHGDVLKMKTDVLRSIFQSNFSVASRLSLLAIKAMRRRKTGRIVNIGYVFADRLQANPRVAAYQAAKTALLSFTSSLAKTAMKHGITINTVSPGIHHITVDPPERPEMVIPAGRYSSDEDIIGAVRYFISPAAHYVTGSHLKVSGGYGV